MPKEQLGHPLDLTEKSLALYNELCERYGRTPEIVPPPPPAPFDKDAWMARQMSKLIGSPMSGSGSLAGGSLWVVNPISGEEHEIELRGGRIVRRSDGKIVRLEIDWSKPPFSFFKGMLEPGIVRLRHGARARNQSETTLKPLVRGDCAKAGPSAEQQTRVVRPRIAESLRQA